MSKYYLVTSFYDGKDFLDERYIPKILGVEFKDLRDIDLFTSSHSKIEILESIYNDLKLGSKNQLAIKRYRNKDAIPDYYSVIFNHPEYHEAISKVKKISYQLPGGRFRDSISVDQRSPLYLSEFSLLKDYLKNRDMKHLKELFGYESELFYLIKRYLSTDYDSDYERKRDYQMIVNEFSSYKTFRYWIIQREKVKRKSTYFAPPSVKRQPIIEERLVQPKSIMEYEEEFSDQFMKEKKITYEEYLTSLNNLSRLSEEKEEFLDQDEYQEMYLEDPKGRGR